MGKKSTRELEHVGREKCSGADPDCPGCLFCQPNAPTRYDYASRRVASLSRDISPKLYSCGKVQFPTACNCPGSRTWGYMTCRQWMLCRRCRVIRQRKIAGKVEVALEQRIADERERAKHGAFGYGGFESTVRITLVTLSVKHSGNIADDKARILAGWTNVRKRYHDEYGKFPSVLVWEVTPGDDLLGHVHAHIAVVWPWRDWGMIGRWFYAGSHGGKDPGASERTSRINFSNGFFKKGQSRRTAKHPATARSMARYLAKYIGKGVDSSEFDPMLTARVSACFYGKRTIIPSHRFWIPRVKECPCCGVQPTRARGIADEWLSRPLPPWAGPEFDANAPPEELLDALERGQIWGFYHLS